jgi:hypothetical protein
LFSEIHLTTNKFENPWDIAEGFVCLFFHVASCCFSILRQNLLMWRETRSARGINIQSKQLYTRSETCSCSHMSPRCVSNCIWTCFNVGVSSCWI